MKIGQRAQRLFDIGSTTALSAMVEIVEEKRKADVGGILARQAKAMLARLKSPQDHLFAIEGFCDELQTFIESVPGAKSAFSTADRTARRR